MKSNEWRSMTEKIYRMDGGRCGYFGCTSEPSEAHHIIFRSQGGEDTPDNLISLCRKHHEMVHNGVTQYGKRYSGKDVMTSILTTIRASGRIKFRWNAALNELKRRAK